MTGFVLLENFTDDPEALLRTRRSRTVSSSADHSTEQPAGSAPTPTEIMVLDKSLREFSVPAVTNVATGPAVDTAGKNFELRTGLITMVQASPFCGLPSEDANAHLQHFLELCDTIVIKDITPDVIRLRLFPFSLVGKAKRWFYQDKEAVNSWAKCSTAFLAKFFPISKTNALRGKISNFQQENTESIPDARERLQEYIQSYPHHGMENWMVL